MKTSKNLFFLLLLFFCSANVFHAQSIRQKYSINENWKFFLNKNHTSLTDLNLLPTESINIPHTWNREDAFDKTDKYYSGEGVYEKKFYIPKQSQSKRIFIYFEGANQVSNIWLNGKYIGEHIGGYSAFSFELTESIKYGEENRLFVKVNNKHDLDIPPLDADFTFYGGIYRDVYLIITNDIHFDLLDVASTGIYITPKIINKMGTVSISSNLCNDSVSDSKVEVVHTIYNSENIIVNSIKEKYLLKSGANINVKCLLKDIHNPKLWSPASPYLYSVKSEIYNENILLDVITTPIGFRDFFYDVKTGLNLNGNPIKLIGVNRHQDLSNRGNALSNIEHIRDLEIIKDNGFNFLRLAHYPQDPIVLKTADKLGLIIWEEIPVVNKITLSASFKKNTEQMLVEMIKQHYNHPSIFMWGYMNEILLRKPTPLPGGYIDSVFNLATHLENILKELDPNRFSVMAQSYEEIDDGTNIGHITDIIGFNLYFGWYYEKFADLTPYLDKYKLKYPDRPIIISEYGAGSDERVHSQNPTSFDFSTEYQQMYHESQFSQIMGNDYLVGSAIWNMFDFGSNSRNDTKFGINQKGIYYYNRTPKDISYFYKANLIKEPFIHIASKDYQNRVFRNGDKEEIKVYSNLDSVALFVNGEHISKNKIYFGTTKWNVSLNKGNNVVKAVSSNNDFSIIDKIKLNLTSANIDFSEKSYHNINVGSNYDFIDNAGVVWHSDKKYVYDSWGYTNGKQIGSKHKIIGTFDDPVYQTALLGLNNYKIDLPEGNYQISLFLSDITYDKSPTNLIAIIINEKENYYFELKENKNFMAHEFSLETSVTGNKGLKLFFTSSIDRTILNGIQIIKLN